MEPNDDLPADWSASELSVLRSAELDRAPHGSVERTLTAIGVGAAVGAGAGLGSASPMVGMSKVGRIAHRAAWLKWLAAAAVGAGIASAFFLSSRQRPRPIPAPAATQAATARAVETPTLTPTPPPDLSALAAPATAPSHAVASARARTDAAEKLDAGKDALAAEIRIIDEARARLRQGDAGGALEALARYEQLVKGRGSMRAEATVVRIEALAASGDRAQASALGERFLTKNPDSPYADYVKRILSQAH